MYDVGGLLNAEAISFFQQLEIHTAIFWLLNSFGKIILRIVHAIIRTCMASSGLTCIGFMNQRGL